MLTTFPAVPLGDTGVIISAVGFGMGPIGWRTEPVSKEELQTIGQKLFARGVRYFDVAPMYGYGAGERRLGALLKGRERSGFTVSTKVGRLVRPALSRSIDDPMIFDYSADSAWRSMEESLQRLELDAVDIALIHDIDRRTHGADQPARFREALAGAYPALAAMKEQGLIRAIGLGVNEWEVCRDVAETVPVDCFMLAGQHSLLNQRARESFLPWCAERNIAVMVAGVFNSGILAKGARPGVRYDYHPASDAILTRVREIEAVCAAHTIALPAAAIAFSATGPAVASVVIGAATEEQIDGVLACADADIPADFWREMAHRRLAPEGLFPG
ncbi:MAG: aldo/keto reductase [Alphaproteobacteria bacterium]|nr:aldo/keto reductase [Alphaproteobacteria bacterium]